ncbi:carboxymuconolactone decarboxylase family protein [Klebsiella pneumoniae]|uniref:carboxymuconolactone decarboxylase family protein n=1 Tax=Klebsiella pneumoniae complex TaxID=3390273 RepID=UPI0021535871|nr:carboxymuconolactone decarboxylase family protein [Klebsiella pneumoniae]
MQPELFRVSTYQCNHPGRSEPEVIKAFFSLNQSLHKSRHLEAKNRELIALAVAVTTRCEGCIAFRM